MSDQSPYGPYEFAEDDNEASRRADLFFKDDPLPEIPPALLCARDFIRYVSATAMLHPFYPTPHDDGRVKPASYEARPGRYFIYWTPDGRKLVTPIKAREDKKFVLPANSITFMQIESRIRLPAYIAIRFNLRIKHVHRGLLLGTGPLVDPEFKGDLLIPLHNLTDRNYEISQTEGLIWIEFTKTSWKPSVIPEGDELYDIEAHKKWVEPEAYFEKASQNNPIRSSIGGVIADSQKRALAAERSAKRAERASALFLTIGFLGVAALVITTAVALHQYFGQIGSLAQGVQDKASTALGKVDQAVSNSDEARKGADEARKEVQNLRGEVNALKAELEQLQGKVNLQQTAPPQPSGR